VQCLGQSRDTDSKGFAINFAGSISQAAGAEIILQVDKIDKNDAFVRGMMTCNMLNLILAGASFSQNSILGSGFVKRKLPKPELGALTLWGCVRRILKSFLTVVRGP
jgi:hypothetical protein